MKIKAWPDHGRVVYSDAPGLRYVEPAVGSLLPPFALQVLAHAATLHGVVDDQKAPPIPDDDQSEPSGATRVIEVLP